MSGSRLGRPRVAVFKFASCDGCQLQLLSCEDELLTIADQIEIVHFLEASSYIESGPYDIALVEGSITTAIDRQRIQDVRAQSRCLVTLGACATAGGIVCVFFYRRRAQQHERGLAPPYIYCRNWSQTASIERWDFSLRGSTAYRPGCLGHST